MSASWTRLCGRSALNLAFTLTNGQSFCWRAGPASSSPSSSSSSASSSASSSTLYTGVVDGRVVTLRERGDVVEFVTHSAVPALAPTPAPAPTGPSSAAVPPKRGGRKRARAEEGLPPAASAVVEAGDSGDARMLAALRDYFQLGDDGGGGSGSDPLPRLYAEWAAADERMRAITAALPGMRVLRQPPVECLISFICSSNNNIARITQMLARLRARYGERLLGDDAEPGAVPARLGGGLKLDEVLCGSGPIRSFPTVEALGAVPSEELRGLGFGYRAKFVSGTAIALRAAGGERFLLSLRGRPRQEVQAALLAFDGVGRKVADCVALFALDQPTVVPVDTHVWNIAVRYLDPALANLKSLTPTVYERVGELFRARYGASHAGWAHSLLFAAELPAYKGRLPAAMQAEMAAVREAEKAHQQEKRDRTQAASAVAREQKS